MTDNNDGRSTSVGYSETRGEATATFDNDFPDISTWSHAKMVAMQEKLAAAITEKQTTGATALIDEMRARALDLGVPLEELLAGLTGKKKRGRKSAQKRDE